MARFAKDYLEAVLFFFLTLSLYFLYLVTVPIFREPHGLLAMSELSDLDQSHLVLGLLFGSSVVCVLLGVLILNWASFLSPGTMANLWAATYLFLWMDTSLSLTLQSGSYRFLISLALGLTFIYLFFFALNYLGPDFFKEKIKMGWKIKVIHYWIWGWMGFYLGLSWFFTLNSFDEEGFRLPLAVGAMAICFINYLLMLFLKRSEGDDLVRFSRSGRVFFILWILGLALFWSGHKWIF